MMTMEKPAIKKLFIHLAWFLFLFVPPIAYSAFISWPGLKHVIATGYCPPAPTDIPAYPCTVGVTRESYILS